MNLWPLPFRRRFAVAALKQLPSDTSQLEAKLAVAATMAGESELNINMQQ
jgi:hypothetical protein